MSRIPPYTTPEQFAKDLFTLDLLFDVTSEDPREMIMIATSLPMFTEEECQELDAIAESMNASQQDAFLDTALELRQRLNNNLKTCQYIDVTTIVPEEWNDWFWSAIPESAPFSWGDCDKSLITASAFYEHCNQTLSEMEFDDDMQVKIDHFLATLRNLKETFINLEN